MKKILLFFFLAVFSVFNVSAQATLFVTAPNGAGTTQLRAPNGLSSAAYMRACVLVLQSELAQLPVNSMVTQFGFTLQSGTSGVAVPGNFTVYIQNTTDNTYQKGTTWSTAITTMTNVFANVMTIPISATTTSIVLTLSTPFQYTGGGLYVAYDWQSNGPFSSTAATYFADNTINPGAATNATTGTAPSTLATTNFRPNFLFGITNTYTNEVQVVGVEALGRIPAILNSPHVISAVIKNSSNTALNNIPVTLNITGANPFANTLTISTLASGATTVVSFPAVNPQLPGAQTVSVSVPADENNANNSATFSQSVTCDTWGRNPATNTFTGTQVGFNTPGGILSTEFVSPVNTNMTGIRAAISNHSVNPGNKMYGVVMNSMGTILATSNTITLGASTQGTIQHFVFSTPVSLTASGSYFYGVAQTYSTNVTQYYPAATHPATYQPQGLYYSSGLTGGPPTVIPQNFGFFGLEAVFQHTVTISAASQTISCGTPATLQALSNTNYSWSTGPTTSSIVVSPTISTSYSVSATNTMGCMASTVVTLSVTPLAINIAISPSIACAGVNMSFTASGAATNYTWAGSTNTVYTSTFSDAPSTTTSYTIMAQNLSTGCSNTIVHPLTVNALPVLNLSTATPTICSGKSVTITASGNSAGYSWGHGPTTPTAALSPSVSTIYSITGISQVGCEITRTVDVTVNTFTPGITSSTAICYGQSIALTTTAQSNIQWSTNSGFSSITVTPAITTAYSVTATGSNGCTGSNSTTITVNSNPTITAVPSRASMCRRENNLLTASGAVTYSWSNGMTTPTIIVTPTAAVPTSFTVTGYNSEGCSHQKVVQLIVNQCNSIDEFGNTAGMRLFPNPASGTATIDLTEAGNLSLYDDLGRLVLNVELRSGENILNLEEYPAGAYQVKFSSDSGEQWRTRLIIRR